MKDSNEKTKIMFTANFPSAFGKNFAASIIVFYRFIAIASRSAIWAEASPAALFAGRVRPWKLCGYAGLGKGIVVSIGR